MCTHAPSWLDVTLSPAAIDFSINRHFPVVTLTAFQVDLGNHYCEGNRHPLHSNHHILNLLRRCASILNFEGD